MVICVIGEGDRMEIIMKYSACYFIQSINKSEEDAAIVIDKEGLTLGNTFVDYADIIRLRPVNHRVFLDLFDGDSIEISMLGFSYDGFYEELMERFSSRSLEALFIEENAIMSCEGEYELPETELTPAERGRGKVMLFPDSVCILPQTSHAVRIPLCFTVNIQLDGYLLFVTLRTGETYMVGRMGYDTKPFAERCQSAAAKTVRERESLLKQIKTEEPFLHPGLFRTCQEEEFWGAALRKDRCAVELYTKEQAATYLYSFNQQQQFLYYLEEAMEAVGSHRAIIFLPEDQLNENPLYRMAVHRSRAVRFLRERSAGRLIHSEKHTEKLREFLEE